MAPSLQAAVAAAVQIDSTYQKAVLNALPIKGLDPALLQMQLLAWGTINAVWEIVLGFDQMDLRFVLFKEYTSPYSRAESKLLAEQTQDIVAKTASQNDEAINSFIKSMKSYYEVFLLRTSAFCAKLPRSLKSGIARGI